MFNGSDPVTRTQACFAHASRHRPPVGPSTTNQTIIAAYAANHASPVSRGLSLTTARSGNMSTEPRHHATHANGAKVKFILLRKHQPW